MRLGETLDAIADKVREYAPSRFACEVMTRRKELAAMRGTRPEARPQHMSDDLKFQLRLTLSDEFAQVARNVPGH